MKKFVKTICVILLLAASVFFLTFIWSEEYRDVAMRLTATTWVFLMLGGAMLIHLECKEIDKR